MEKDRRKSNLKLTQKCVKMTKTIFGKVRKALGNMSALTSEKGLAFLGRSRGTSEFEKSRNSRQRLRNSRQRFSSPASHWIDNSLLWRHSRLRKSSDMFGFLRFCYFNAFLCAFLGGWVGEKLVSDSIFCLFPSKSTSHRWSTPLQKTPLQSVSPSSERSP